MENIWARGNAELSELTEHHDADIMISMKTRTIVSMERAQLRALKGRARAAGISVAELVRRLVADSLKADQPAVRSVPRSAFEQLVALGSSGRADIADRHDALVGEALRQEHDR